MAVETLRHPAIEPAHPGEILSEIMIPATGRSKAEIARLLGISRQTLYDILKMQAACHPAVAVRPGKLFGDGAGIWVRGAGSARHLACRTGNRRKRRSHDQGSSDHGLFAMRCASRLRATSEA